MNDDTLLRKLKYVIFRDLITMLRGCDPITEDGSSRGTPSIRFNQKEIVADVEQEDGSWEKYQSFNVYWGENKAYINLVPNTFGMLMYPDGGFREIKEDEGGLLRLPVGSYRLYFIDRHERSEFSNPISEMTSNGERITLKFLIRYKVLNPKTAMSLERPAEALFESIETDIAQYIRTRNHNEIADTAQQEKSKILAYFQERHQKREKLARAFFISNVELKDFSGDKEFVGMRRDVLLQTTEKKIADLKREMELKTVEQANLIKKLELESSTNAKRAYQELEQRDIELNNLRMQEKHEAEIVSNLLASIAQSANNGRPLPPESIEKLLQLSEAFRRKNPTSRVDIDEQLSPTIDSLSQKPQDTKTSPYKDIDTLTKTLLDMLG